MTTKRLLVAGPDKQVFEVNRDTFEPIGPDCYDPYCFSNPLPDADYISPFEWSRRKNAKFPNWMFE